MDFPPIRALGPADLPACSDLAEARDWPRKWALLQQVGRVFRRGRAGW
ncbi:hypothetical protein ABJI51_32760 [Amycolatopsis sp. NEAU-NG30]|uniref:GNAT family N-acetyltransferase n=1 Tax=Amycolatopsis melonis TaxID=3156488 RepID=A0ABV0LNL4_9PSEU